MRVPRPCGDGGGDRCVAMLGSTILTQMICYLASMGPRRVAVIGAPTHSRNIHIFAYFNTIWRRWRPNVGGSFPPHRNATQGRDAQIALCQPPADLLHSLGFFS